MSAIRLEQIEGNDAGLKAALTEAHLPTDDIEDHGRTFYRALSSDGRAIGFLGVERCGDDFLLRSVVVLPDHLVRRGAIETSDGLVAQQKITVLVLQQHDVRDLVEDRLEQSELAIGAQGGWGTGIRAI